MQRPVQIAIAGVGGFARVHHETCQRLEAEGESKLVATCDPNLQQVDETLRFREREVQLFEDFDVMLEHCALGLDLVIVATPIPLHAPMHTAALNAGLAVYLEKPPSLDYSEFNQMTKHESGAKFRTLVGFNFILEPERRQLKQRILDGEFGRIQDASFVGWWPRSSQYFARTAWAGKLKLGRRLVLDSCFGNAMAHFVHNMLFWLGPRLESFGDFSSVRAALYRAHAIQTADTFFVQARAAGEVNLRIAMTHACSEGTRHVERIECEHATIIYEVGKQALVEWRDGRVEDYPLIWPDSVALNHRHYYGYLRGGSEQPHSRLADCEPFVALNALAFLSSQAITPWSQTLVRHTQHSGQDFLDVVGLDAALNDFAHHGRWPKAKLTPTEMPAQVTREALSRLEYVAATMLSDVEG